MAIFTIRFEDDNYCVENCVDCRLKVLHFKFFDSSKLSKSPTFCTKHSVLGASLGKELISSYFKEFSIDSRFS